MIHLVRDVLDTQVLDRSKRPMGKVDGLVLELRAGRSILIACAGPRYGASKST